MKRGSKYHTIAILPSTPGKKILKLSLPCCLWPIVCLILAAVLGWAGLGTWSLYQHHRMMERCARLERENATTKIQLEQERLKVIHLDEEIKNVQKQARFVREFLGLEPQVQEKGKLGQGGVEVSPLGLPLPPEGPSLSKSSSLGPAEAGPQASLSPRDISQLQQDFEQIIDALQDRRQEMEHTPSVSPVDPQKSWISSSYGLRVSPFTGKRQFHLGVDIAGWKGTPILATAKGKIIYAGKWGSLGLVTKIRHNSTYTTVYGHLLKIAVKKGQEVERGEVIGYMGNSGRSTGYHVHYEVTKNGKSVNPFSFMMDWDRNVALLAENED